MKDLSKDDLETVKKFIAGIEAKLPATFFEGMHRPLWIHFSASSKSLEEEAGHVKESNPSQVILSDKLLSSILTGPSTTEKIPNVPYSNAYYFSEGTLVHELAHVWDSTQRVQASESRAFRKIETWRKGMFSTHQLNRSDARSIEGYENYNPEESFAINFEHFVLDPNFSARKPTLSRYFQESFQFSPPQNSQAKATDDIIASDLSKRQIDPKRVYRIDYILAGPKGAGISSQGHSMLRIVICAPFRKVVGPECLEDLDWHLVVNPGAYTEDGKFKVWKGLTGSYPMVHSIQPLNTLVAEYSQLEDRDLIAYPLLINADEQKQILDRVKEYYWTYQTGYKFITENCATEILNLLQSALYDDPITDDCPLIATPRKLKKILGKEERINLKAPKTENKDLFSSFSTNFDDDYHDLLETLHDKSKWPKDAKDFLKLDPDQRQNLYHTAFKDTQMSEENKSKISMLLLQFEYQLKKKYEKNFLMSEFDKINSGKDTDSLNCNGPELVASYQEKLKLFSPSVLASPSYGVPLEGELIADKELEKRQKLISDAMEALLSNVDYSKSPSFTKTQESIQILFRHLSTPLLVSQ